MGFTSAPVQARITYVRSEISECPRGEIIGIVGMEPPGIGVAISWSEPDTGQYAGSVGDNGTQNRQRIRRLLIDIGVQQRGKSTTDIGLSFSSSQPNGGPVFLELIGGEPGLDGPENPWSNRNCGSLTEVVGKFGESLLVLGLRRHGPSLPADKAYATDRAYATIELVQPSNQPY
jgi:hypothetical protein